MSGSASGITGWHKCHLTALAHSSEGSEALTKILNLIYRQNLPTAAFACINTSILLPLKKKLSDKIRPILTPDIFVRIIGKCALIQEQSVFLKQLSPIQVAVGTSGGSDIAIHGIRAHQDAFPTHSLIAVDFANAFGSISRHSIAHELSSFTDGRASFSSQFFNTFCSRRSKVLQSDGNSFFYSDGVPQGGPLSMQFFCLALQPILESVASSLLQDSGKVIAYADDVFLLGPSKSFSLPSAPSKHLPRMLTCSSKSKNARS